MDQVHTIHHIFDSVDVILPLIHPRIGRVCGTFAIVSIILGCYVFPSALLYADTSDCLLSSLPHPFTGPLYFYDLILLTRSHLVASCLVRYTSSVAMRSPMYDTHLRATHTTTSGIGGVQIPIYLVSDATDSL